MDSVRFGILGAGRGAGLALAMRHAPTAKLVACDQDFKAGLPHPKQGYNWRTEELALRRGHHYITHDLGPLYQVFGERVTQVVCLGSGQHHLSWGEADDTCIVLLSDRTWQSDSHSSRFLF